MLKPEYLAALPVVPIIAVGMALQGVYLLTSIGLNLTSRTEFYPVVDVHGGRRSDSRSGSLLIPRYGVVGAALTVLVSYAHASSSSRSCSRSASYPIHYEVGRLIAARRRRRRGGARGVVARAGVAAGRRADRARA